MRFRLRPSPLSPSRCSLSIAAVVGMLATTSTALSACNAPPLEGSSYAGSAPAFPPDDASTSSSSGSVDPDSRNASDAGDETSREKDTDGDLVPDEIDCDPTASTIGERLVEDDLATAKGLIAPAPGFDAAAWSHAGGAYHQNVVRNGGDVAIFKMEPLTQGGVAVDIHSSTIDTGAFTPKLHQDFILVGASFDGGQMRAFGCGVEYVEGSNPPNIVSIVQLSGPASAVRTTPLKRDARPFLPTKRDFSLSARVSPAGLMTCSFREDAAPPTTVTAMVGPVSGAIGLYTAQTSALFRDVRICRAP